MTVNHGNHVKIHLLSAGGLTEELHESFEERNANNSLAGYNGTDVDEAMEAAEGSGLLQHGLTINGTYEDSLVPVKTTMAVTNATSVQELVNKLNDAGKMPTLSFTANKVGTFSIYCTVSCGEYHPQMFRTNAFIVV